MENKTLREKKISDLIKTYSPINHTINVNKFNISTKYFKDESNQTISLKDLINMDKLNNRNKKKIISDSNINIHTINLNNNILQKIKLDSNTNNSFKNKLTIQNKILHNSHQTYLTLSRDNINNINLRKGKLLKLSKLFKNTNQNYYIESNLNRFYHSEKRESNKQKIIPKIKQDKSEKYRIIPYHSFENKNKYKKKNDKIKFNERLIPIHSEKVIQYTENHFHIPSKSKSPLSDMSELIPDIRRKKRINNYLLFEMNEYYKKRNTHFKFKL
jgi:hypothetical protein